MEETRLPIDPLKGIKNEAETRIGCGYEEMGHEERYGYHSFIKGATGPAAKAYWLEIFERELRDKILKKL